MKQTNTKTDELTPKNTNAPAKEQEIGGAPGLEPTRYGGEYPEWERKGRVSDF